MLRVIPALAVMAAVLSGCRPSSNGSSEKQLPQLVKQEHRRAYLDMQKSLRGYLDSPEYQEHKNTQFNRLVTASSKLEPEDIQDIRDDGLCSEAMAAGRSLIQSANIDGASAASDRPDTTSPSAKGDSSPIQGDKPPMEGAKREVEREDAALSVLLLSSAGALVGLGFKFYEYKYGVRYEGKTPFAKMRRGSRVLFIGSVLIEIGAPLVLATVAALMLSGERPSKREHELVHNTVLYGSYVEGAIHILGGLLAAYGAINDIAELRRQLPSKKLQKAYEGFIQEEQRLLSRRQAALKEFFKEDKNNKILAPDLAEKLQKGTLDAKQIFDIKTIAEKNGYNISIETLPEYSEMEKDTSQENIEFNKFEATDKDDYILSRESEGKLENITAHGEGASALHAGIKTTAAVVFTSLGIASIVNAPDESIEMELAGNGTSSKSQVIKAFRSITNSCKGPR